MVIALSIGIIIKFVFWDSRTSKQSEYSFENSNLENYVRPSGIIDEIDNQSRQEEKFSSALKDVRTKGSYLKLKESLRSMPRTERLSFLLNDLCSLESGFGFRLDIPEKLAIIDEFGEGRSSQFKRKILTGVAYEIDPLGDVDFLRAIDRNLWRETVAALAFHDATKAFELSKSDLGIERQQEGIGAVLNIWLEADSTAASETISKMPEGYLRDFATSKIVIWLVEKDCFEDAKLWTESISDPEIRRQMAEKVSER